MAGSFTFDLTSSNAATASYAGGAAQINYCGVTFSEPPTLGTEPVTAYLTVNPADYSQGSGVVYVVVSTTDGYTSTWSMPGIVISAAQMPVITQEVSTGTATGPTVSPRRRARRQTATWFQPPSQSYSFDATVAGNGVITGRPSGGRAALRGRTLSAENTGGGYAKTVVAEPAVADRAGGIFYADGEITFALTGVPPNWAGMR